MGAGHIPLRLFHRLSVPHEVITLAPAAILSAGLERVLLQVVQL